MFLSILVYTGVAYLILGQVLALIFLAVSLADDIRGLIDPKYGYSYKNPLTYLLAISVACPILNLIIWIPLCRNMLKNYKNGKLS